jgi:hypothetical protein
MLLYRDMEIITWCFKFAVVVNQEHFDGNQNKMR